MKRRLMGSLFGVAAVAMLVAQGARFDTVKECPLQCRGLDSGDWSYWLLGCWEFGSACSGAVEAFHATSPTLPPLMSRIRMRAR